MYGSSNLHTFITKIIFLFVVSPHVKEQRRPYSKMVRVRLNLRHQDLELVISKGIEDDERVRRRLGMFFISFECGICQMRNFIKEMPTKYWKGGRIVILQN